MALTPGDLLRKKREEKNLSLEQAAKDTNIRIHFLQALEEDRRGNIASEAQQRGFQRLYASYLGLDLSEAMASINGEPTNLTESVSKPPREIEQNQVRKPIRLITDLLGKLSKPKPDPMGKTDSIPVEPVRPVTQSSDNLSDRIFLEIGQQLQSQREGLGLSRLDVERQIKIRELYIFALENGQINDLPSSVQGRGMLNNYAAFMNLDPEALQTRFAEGLQQKRLEKIAEETAQKNRNELKKYSAPVTSWRRYLTPDLLIGGSVFAVLFILIIWGALQVIGSSQQLPKPTTDSIASILISTETPTLSLTEAAPSSDLTTTPQPGDIQNTPSVNLLATITAIGNNPIQVVVVAYQRAFLKIIADGNEVFKGRIIPGSVYTFTGTSKVTLTTGNAAAMQVYYNQQDLGILGLNGQVLNMEFTTKGVATPTAQFTSSPTATQRLTQTQPATQTLTSTTTPVAPTLTPFKP
jgi:cytoskeletal protein RodZ